MKLRNIGGRLLVCKTNKDGSQPSHFVFQPNCIDGYRQQIIVGNVIMPKVLVGKHYRVIFEEVEGPYQ